MELSYPESEIFLEKETFITGDCIRQEGGLEDLMEGMGTEDSVKQERRLTDLGDMVDAGSLQGGTPVAPQTETDLLAPGDGHRSPAVAAELELDGPALTLEEDPLEFFHNYSKLHRELDEDELQPSKSPRPEEGDDGTEQEQKPSLEEESNTQGEDVKPWKARALRARRYAHLLHHCDYCHKDFKGGNVIRHSISHLKRRRLRCIFCGSCFKNYNLAKQHVLKHIEDLLNNPPGRQEPNGTEPRTPTVLAVDGTTEPSGNENQVHEPKAKPEISKQARIIQNLRILLKKAKNFHKSPEEANCTGQELMGFKDEQVIVRDKRVILKKPAVKEGKEGGEREREAGENGLGTEYPLCPAEDCNKIFMRIGPSLLKHALIFHTGDPVVLEKTFLWAKGRCIFCQRHMLNIQHYIDHMKLHDAPLRQICVHLSCSQRFKTPQELKEHTETHRPLQPQCLFPGCELLFSTLSGLQDHEWRHYTQPDLQLKEGPGQPDDRMVNSEAPWKHRVKIQELWPQGGKGQRETDTPMAQVPDAATKPGTVAVGGEAGQTLDTNNKASNTASGLPSDPSLRPINGHQEGNAHRTPQGDPAALPASQPTPTPPRARSRSKGRNSSEPPLPGAPETMNVKELEELATLSEVLKTIEEPVIPAHTSFKPEDPSYALFVKAPFIRPPPSTYLDESALSMRKRNKAPAVTSSPQAGGKKQQPVADKEVAAPQRQRCTRCLSCFSGPEELQQHQALNTCSSLFSFDSDDDS